MMTVTSNRRDEKIVKKYTVADYQDTTVTRLRSQDKNRTYVWRFHSENEPCKVVSLRAYQAHLGKEAPAQGNRLLIQALVKFDTLQVSLYHITNRFKVI